MGVMLCDDLISFSRVAAAARAAGLVVRQARTQADALKLARTSATGGVLVDLHNDTLDLPALLASLHSLEPVPRVVAFGSHVDAERLKAARAAGCDRVLPRSAFVQELETDIATWLTPVSHA
jgi:DNA-binding NarL/FixJ family response regulator